MPAPEFNNTQTPEPLTKVRPIPGFEEYAPAAAFGGGRDSRPAEELAQVSGEAVQRHKENADDAYVKGLYGQAMEASARIITGPDGVLNQKITDQAQVDTAFAALDNAWGNLKTKNADQERMFGVMKAKLHADMFDSVMKKASADVIEQGRQHVEKLNAAATTLAMGDFDHAEDRLREVRANSEHARMGKEETEPDFNYRVTNAMLDAGQIERAKAWKEDPNHYYGKMADKMDKNFENSQKIHDVQTAYHAIISTSGDEKSAIAKVDKIDDAIQQKKVRGLVQGYFTAHTKALQDGEMHSFLNISNNVKPGSDPSTMTGFSMLSAKHQADLIRQADPNFTGNMSVAKQWSAMTAQEIKGMSKEEFYDDFYSKLPHADRKDAEAQWKFQTQQGWAKGAHASDAMLRNDVRLALVQAGVVDKGLKPSEWSSDDLTNYDNLRISIKQDIEAYKDAHKGGDPDRDTIHKMINEAVSTKYKDGLFGQKQTGGFTPVEGVDPKRQKVILNRFQGIELSASQIKEYNQAWHNRDAAKLEELEKEFRK